MILYGMPTGEAFELAEQGNVILGGCEIIMDDTPQADYGCLDCKYEWVPELLPASDISKIRFKFWTSTVTSGEVQEELKVPFTKRESSSAERAFNLQISYTDGRKICRGMF